ncbi:MAG: STAS domain-containing protein [Gammaproteobacteria bacterium]|nr:STAS domain-containing protein [Gammaproteobacteria bacterium]
MEMILPTIARQDTNQFVIKGELNMQTVPALAVTAHDLLAQVSGELSVDLSGVTRADSAGLALLIDLTRWTRRQGAHIRFRHLPEQLSQILHLSELDEILPI